MEAEVVSKIAALARQSILADNLVALVELGRAGSKYAFPFRVVRDEDGVRLGDMIEPPTPATLRVTTLTGFVDALKAGIQLQDAKVVHIEDPLNVSWKTLASDEYGNRDTVLKAVFEPTGQFEFDKYMDSERFLIGLQTSFLFIDGDDSLYVQKLVSNLKAGETVHAQDDGINQSVTLKTGQVEAAEHNVKSRVSLCPIRTFSEVPAARSNFLLRLKPHPQNQLPLVALFSLEGTKWKSDTMLGMKTYLERHLGKETKILA